MSAGAGSRVEQGAALGARLRAGDRRAAAAALNLIDDRSPAGREASRALLDEVSPSALGGEARAQVIGLTGPPGAGKSSLLSALVASWREDGRTVAVLAVDPTSKRSGGSLLGDRVRIEHDPEDDGVLIRSTAAGTRLGGLAAPTRDAATALAPAYDVVVIETVGVGQSETDVAEVADTTVVVVQPGSGDTLQFLKAGIMEVPDVLVVTKADLGSTAARAERDLAAALGALGAGDTPVLPVSSVPPPSGIVELVTALDTHRSRLDTTAVRWRARVLAALADFTTEQGERGVAALGGRRQVERFLQGQDPSRSTGELIGALEELASSSSPSSPSRDLSLVSDAVEDYARAHTTPPPPHREALAEETRATLSAPQMLTGTIEGRLLEMLVFLAQPRLVLEIGTYSGYSALSMAQALPHDASIVTCEIADEHADIAERHIAAAGLADRIEVRRGPALATIATLEGPFDLVFIDADKTGYRDYYEAVLPKLSERGLIAVDNVLWSGRVAADPSPDDESTRALRAFNDHVAADERVVCVMLTVRDGLTLVRRA